jgi:hypothetical protein
MMEVTCDQLLSLGPRLGNVSGLMTLASKADQIAAKLLLPAQCSRGELYELRRCLATLGEMITHLRRTAISELQALGVEQDNG